MQWWLRNHCLFIWLALLNLTFNMGPINRICAHRRITPIFLGFSSVILGKGTQIIKKFSYPDFSFFSWIGFFLSEKKKSVLEVWNEKIITNSKICKLTLLSFDLLEFLIWGLEDFIKVNEFKLFKSFFKLKSDEFVEFS